VRLLSPHTTVHAGPHTAVLKIELRVTNEVGVTIENGINSTLSKNIPTISTCCETIHTTH